TNVSTRDFTLQATSPAIDAGTVLTTTTTSCSANSVTVADAGYFHDGYGMINGDTVQIGTQTRVLTGVNYATNLLTWSGASVTCGSGTGVSLPYAGLAPDMGAQERVTTPALHLSVTAQPQTTARRATMAPIVVQVQDAANALVTSSSAPVTLTLTAGPG